MNLQLNEQVIIEICRFLSVTDLKTVRSLNKNWNLGSKPILVKKGCNLLDLENFEISEIKLNSFIGNHFPCKAIRIINNFEQNGNPDNLPNPSNMDTISKFFYPNSQLLPPVNYLQLNFKIRAQRDEELLNDILQYYSQSLKILVLALDANCKIKFRTSLTFPKLEIYWDYGWANGSPKTNTDMLFPAAPNIVSIWVMSKLQGNDGIMSLLRNPELLKLYVNNVTVAGINYLNSLQKRLILFCMQNFKDGEDKVALYSELESFLQIQAESLEALNLIGLKCEEQYLKSGQKLKFPTFPNLTFLKIAFEDFGLKFEFGGNGNVNYGRDLPKLMSLNISSKHKTGYDPQSLRQVYESFFPENGNQICESLKVVLIQRRNMEVVQNLGQRLRKLFPNANIMDLDIRG